MYLLEFFSCVLSKGRSRKLKRDIDGNSKEELLALVEKTSNSQIKLEVAHISQKALERQSQRTL